MESSDSSSATSELTTKFTKERSVLRLGYLNALLTTFSPSDRLLLYLLTTLMGASALALLSGANSIVSVNVPSSGGSITEGLVGPARFVNPLLAISAADQDLTALVYSGLTRARPDGGTTPDLAESYVVSDDGTAYTFTLRDDAVFHDGNPVTSADVLYTIKRAQNPETKSTHRADWEGVQIATPDDRTVIFTLPHAYAPFIENTSLGILPEHLWKDTSSEDFPFNPLNTHPIGSGPYKVISVDEDSTGSATRFELAPFGKFAHGSPHVDRITFRLYPNEEAVVQAFNGHDIDAIAGVSSEQIGKLDLKDSTVIRSTLPRIFGVFLNQNHTPVFAEASVREALDVAIDKNRLIALALGGYASALSGPIPPVTSEFIVPTAASTTVSTAYTLESVDRARRILAAGGWVFTEATGEWKKGTQVLAFTLATADTPELVTTANAVATAWRQVGIKVTVQVYPLSELNTTIIRPREYGAILFGEVVGREPDLYAFWHSTQRNDPGLNLSLYANAKADTLLTQARATTKKEERDKLYTEFAGLIQEDRPAIFLYAPDFLYVIPKSIVGVQVRSLTTPAERYLNVHEWYTDTENVWEIFARDTK